MDFRHPLYNNKLIATYKKNAVTNILMRHPRMFPQPDNKIDTTLSKARITQPNTLPAVNITRRTKIDNMINHISQLFKFFYQYIPSFFSYIL